MKSGGDSLDHRCPRCNYDSGGERSPRSQRFFHAIVAAAYENWPEGREPFPSSSAHLRAWLLCHPRVEFAGAIEGPVSALPMFEDICKGLRERGERFFVGGNEVGNLVLRVPRTAALAARGGPRKGEFYSLVSRVLAVIEEETGIPRESLRREGLSAVAPRPRLGKRKAA